MAKETKMQKVVDDFFVFDYWIDVDDIDTKAVIMSDTCATPA